MRILLDECVPRALRRYLSGHAVLTVQSVGWTGMSDGALLARIDGEFDVFVTADASLPYEQDLTHRAFAVLVLLGRTSARALADRAAEIRETVVSLRPGTWRELGDEQAG